MSHDRLNRIDARLDRMETTQRVQAALLSELAFAFAARLARLKHLTKILGLDPSADLEQLNVRMEQLGKRLQPITKSRTH